MKRNDLKNAIATVTADLTETNMSRTLSKVFRGVRNPRERDDISTSIQTLIDTQSQYRKITASYGKTEIQLLQTLKIDRLLTDSFWSQVLSDIFKYSQGEKTPVNSKTRNEIFTIHERVHLILHHLPPVIDLLERDYDSELAKSLTERESGYKNKDILRILILEDEGETTTPTTASKVLIAIEKIYDIFVSLDGKKHDKIDLVGLDSGSDKSFDFLGLASAVKEIRELILGAYDRHQANKSLPSKERLALVDDSLNSMERINVAVKAKKISKEDGNKFKKLISKNVDELFKAGGITEDVLNVTAPTPRQLMKPDRKMLTPPPKQIELKNQDDDLNDGESYIDDEIE